MQHDTSFDVIKRLNEIRNFLGGIASVGPEHLREKAKELINWIDEAIGDRP